MNEVAATSNRLDRPVDPAYDHVLGPDDAAITLVEYGSYACPHCRAANERVAQVRNELGDRVRYVFRQRPLAGNDLALRAAQLAESADREQFWQTHVELMTRSVALTEDDLCAVRDTLGLDRLPPEQAEVAGHRGIERVLVDVDSAAASGVRVVPTFFINGRRYDGPWDESSFTDAMLGSLGHRVRSAALDFASWAPSTGVLLLLASVLAVLLTNLATGEAFRHFWETDVGLVLGDAGFRMSLHHWVNDGLLSVFFLVVGLEIKREFTVGHLASRRSAALPIAAAIGGMTIPALLYLAVVPAVPWGQGWGVPMATDTAFAIALIAMLGSRVPVELRIFLTAAAIVDDIGAIVVVALFYSSKIDWGWLGAASACFVLLVGVNRSGVYRALPYAALGVVLWFCVYKGGLHATLAGVLLALVIPTRPPANLRSLMTQADQLIAEEALHGDEQLRHGPSLPTLRQLDAIHDRLESPADRTLRHLEPWSSYFVLPVFALANAGVVLSLGQLQGHDTLMMGVMLGLVVGKPLGLFLASWLAVRTGMAVKPEAYSWTQLLAAGALAGIGFTMSLFIAGQAFPVEADFAAAKIAVFAASTLSALIGVALLLWASRTGARAREPVQEVDDRHCSA
ncbi:Na+/H+ antiporter NhaA [Thermomonas sp. HDW16]|uniref:Na+/H+ antiporter NhaA n=1 Tax=Thermomonas sp. HDW16 TaxID=2714945 RepID=UPI00140ABA67|nr:Na+/H+ antiporter NhaA [Thermomonas sp. HDW16]QIL20772.1 Na+/H+ antiporter NhaA [Thermomonas sp. HDW16]